jgi:hypothetical protein
VRRCHELFRQGFAFEHAVEWVPVDYWCEADLGSGQIRLCSTCVIRRQNGAALEGLKRKVTSQHP